MLPTPIHSATDHAPRRNDRPKARLPRDPSLVSVVITTYNRPSYLKRAVESVCDQTYAPIELVVVDDHSPEPAAKVLEAVDLSGLRAVDCIRHDTNRGANAAGNTGLDAASGEYVAFLNDDRWIPEKVERQVAIFRAADGNVGVVYCGRETVRADNREVIIPPEVDGDMTKTLLCQNVICSLSVVMIRPKSRRLCLLTKPSGLGPILSGMSGSPGGPSSRGSRSRSLSTISPRTAG